MKTVKAAFFDLDGTLVDTEVYWVKATWLALTRVYDFPLTADEVQLLVYGRAWGDIYRHLVASYPDRCGTITEMEAAIEVEFRGLTAVNDTTIPGSVDCMRRLAEVMPVAIVSGSPGKMIADAIAKMGVEDCVTFHLGSERYSPGKPSPVCYLMAAEQLAVDPKHCIVFEDSQAGVTAAKAAGMGCIGLKRPGNTQDISHADLVLSSLADFDLDAWLKRPRG